MVKTLFKLADQKTQEQALGNASYHNKTAIIRFLLNEGVNPNVKDQSGWPILLNLARFGNKEMIELYLTSGGDVHAVDVNKSNALHYCSAYNGNLETMKYLISLGVDYKAKNENGKTPLEFAIQNHNNELADFLKEVEKK